jgi:hypothetical protein
MSDTTVNEPVVVATSHALSISPDTTTKTRNFSRRLAHRELYRIMGLRRYHHDTFVVPNVHDHPSVNLQPVVQPSAMVEGACCKNEGAKLARAHE